MIMMHSYFFFFFMRLLPMPTLFPYTTLFRSRKRDVVSPATLPGGAHPMQGLAFIVCGAAHDKRDRKSTRLNSSHANISYAVFCLKKKKRSSPTCCRTMYAWRRRRSQIHGRNH